MEREGPNTNAGPDAAESPLLAPYRVVDLTDERGLIAGFLLAQLGADVIRVEPPEGLSARSVPPFRKGDGKPGDSLFWSAYAAGTRSISIAMETDLGREQFLSLVASADVLIESATPGAMADLSLSYDDLRAVNPRLVYVSITAYGDSGPKSGYADSDLTVWAAAGPLAMTRDPASRRPLGISIPQTFHQAACDAVCGALMALLVRGEEGPGQHVEVSAQASNTLCTLFSHLAAPVGHEGYSMSNAGLKKKDMDLSGSGARTEKTIWKVRDGTVEMHIGIGTAAGRFANALFAWLTEIGECPAEFADWDWIALPDRIRAGELTMEDVERARAAVEPVLARFDKNELVTIAERNGLMMAPILTTADLITSPQLLARNFFVPTGTQGEQLLPAPFNGCTQSSGPWRPAPAIGEHTDEVLAECIAAGEDA